MDSIQDVDERLRHALADRYAIESEIGSGNRRLPVPDQSADRGTV